jgi:hypothetical protein
MARAPNKLLIGRYLAVSHKNPPENKRILQFFLLGGSKLNVTEF